MQKLKLNELKIINGGFLPAAVPVLEAISAGATIYIGASKFIEYMDNFSSLRAKLVEATYTLNQFGAQLGEDIFTITHPNVGK